MVFNESLDEVKSEEECSTFNKDDCTIMESIVNMVEMCCLFERAVLLEVEKPQEQELRGRVMESTKSVTYAS